jgi:hypothetical protein
VILLKYLPVLAGLTLILGVLRINAMFRARAMRAFAARWGLQYIGPVAYRWFNPSHPKISPPLPAWFSQACHPYGRGIRQIWNVIEGQQSGVSVLIFDGIIGVKGGSPCTFIACETEQNPFGINISSDHVIQSGGWTILHGVRFLLFTWTMSITRLDNYMNDLRTGSASSLVDDES